MQPRFQMALYKVTVKVPLFRNGIRLEKGMSVDVIMSSPAYYPLHHEGGKSIVDAFLRIYGIDLRKANAVNSSVLEVVKVG